MRRQIGRIVNSNHFVTAAEIKARLEETHPDFEVSEQTIRDELFRLAYTATLPRRVPLLTEQAKQNRLEWAQNYSHYDWRKVVFSDETTLQMFRNTCLAWSKSKNIHLNSMCGEQFAHEEKLDCTHLWRIWIDIYIDKFLMRICMIMQLICMGINAGFSSRTMIPNILQKMFVQTLN